MKKKKKPNNTTLDGYSTSTLTTGTYIDTIGPYIDTTIDAQDIVVDGCSTEYSWTNNLIFNKIPSSRLEFLEEVLRIFKETGIFMLKVPDYSDYGFYLENLIREAKVKHKRIKIDFSS